MVGFALLISCWIWQVVRRDQRVGLEAWHNSQLRAMGRSGVFCTVEIRLNDNELLGGGFIE